MWDPGGAVLRVDSVKSHQVFTGYDDRWLDCARQVGGTWEDVEKVVLLPNIAAAIQKMVTHIELMFPKRREDSSRIFRIVKVAFYVCSLTFGEKEALEWADDFRFPTGLGAGLQKDGRGSDKSCHGNAIS